MLNASYACTLFHERVGLPLFAYLTQQRLAHAQRLLITTDKKVIDVALGSGFGSLAPFYKAFTRHCGITPRQYR